MNNDLQFKTSIDLNASPSQVWAAIVDPEQVKQYFFGTNVQSDWQVGSPITFTGVWEGKEYEDKGTILAIEPEKLLTFNYWSSFSGKEDKPENYSTISYHLQPTNSGTQLTLTQAGFDTTEALNHSQKNWEQVLQAMKDFLKA